MGVVWLAEKGGDDSSGIFQSKRIPRAQGFQAVALEKTGGNCSLHVRSLSGDGFIAYGGEVSLLIAQSASLPSHAESAAFATITCEQGTHHGPQPARES